jgi:hypothetical protein
VCRALKVLCAADGRDRLLALKRATVSADWELVGGAASVAELEDQLGSWDPDIVVLDVALAGADEAIGRAHPRGRVATVGGHDDAGFVRDEVRSAVLGLPRPGGPVGSPSA